MEKEIEDIKKTVKEVDKDLMQLKQHQDEAELKRLDQVGLIISKTMDIAAELGRNPDPKDCFMAKITKDGRITIPSEFREIHGLEEANIVQLSLISLLVRKPPQVFNR